MVDRRAKWADELALQIIRFVPGSEDGSRPTAAVAPRSGQSANTCFACAEPTWRARTEFLRGGTNSSNPSPSRGESTNHRFRRRFYAANSDHPRRPTASSRVGSYSPVVRSTRCCGPLDVSRAVKPRVVRIGYQRFDRPQLDPVGRPLPRRARCFGPRRHRCHYSPRDGACRSPWFIMAS
jgi:hypothetical protein